MHKKLLFVLGGLILLAATVFLWYSYSNRTDSPEKKIDAKKEIDDLSGNNDNGDSHDKKFEEEKVSREITNENLSDIPDPDEISNKNTAKFDSDEDEEEETDDGVTIEVETDDE